MSNRKFKKGDNILVIKGRHKGMRGTISGCILSGSPYSGAGRPKYQVTFEHFKTFLYSYQMKLDTAVELTDKCKKSGSGFESRLPIGALVLLSKKGLAKVYMDGHVRTGHSYDWVLEHNIHKISGAGTFDDTNFYTLEEFADNYYFTDDDLVRARYQIGDRVQFTRETLVKLGAELSNYYGNDTLNKLPQDIIGPREILSIGTIGDKTLYQLGGKCFGKSFYEHEIEPAND